MTKASSALTIKAVRRERRESIGRASILQTGLFIGYNSVKHVLHWLTMTPVRARVRTRGSMPSGQRWLVFVHQLPAQPSNGRVKTWRRLQQMGAIAVKNAVYVLPNNAQAMEDFEWLRTEVAALGGEATLFEAASVDGLEEQQTIARFRSARAEDYNTLSKDIKNMRTKIRQSFRTDEDGLRAIRGLRERFDDLRRIDFFSASGGAETENLLAALEAEGRRPSSAEPRGRQQPPPLHVRDFHRRAWVTRPRPGVDRFSSAWLIRRFVDPDARFVFAPSPDRYPDAVPFDMYQSGGFKHEGDLCTFEVLLERFGLKDIGLRKIAELVHDLDLKDDRYKSPHAQTMGALIDGLRASCPDDEKLLEQGIAVFEALYLSFQPSKSKYPRPRC
jgi:hypothetical protein